LLGEPAGNVHGFLYPSAFCSFIVKKQLGVKKIAYSKR